MKSLPKENMQRSRKKIIGIKAATFTNQPLWQKLNITLNKKVIKWKTTESLSSITYSLKAVLRL